MIPPDLRASLWKNLSAQSARLTPVSGGDINAAARVETDEARYFVKWNTASPPRMFEAEARGLQLLTAANALRIPRVIALIDQPPALVLEWIDAGADKQAAAEALGRGLAQQHRSSAPAVRPRSRQLSSDRIRSATRRPDRGSSSIVINGWACSAIWRSATAISRPIGRGGSIG